jgi:hypothetical protein
MAVVGLLILRAGTTGGSIAVSVLGGAVVIASVLFGLHVPRPGAVASAPWMAALSLALILTSGAALAAVLLC